MSKKARAYSEKASDKTHYAEVAEKAFQLSWRLQSFATAIRGGMAYPEASKEFERVKGFYHHTDRFISDTHRKHPQFFLMWQWRGVEWAWEGVSSNMYGTLP